MTPLEAIRMKCKDCCCGQVGEVKSCEAKDCPLHPFRMGKNPFRKKRELTDEEKAEIAKRLHGTKEQEKHNV